MGANSAFLLLVMAALSSLAVAQSGRTVRHSRVPAEDPSASAAVTQAEAAIEKKDYTTAEQRLNEAVGKNPNDYQAWYDLGYVLNATGHKPEAIDAYRKSVAAKADVFESNLNLGTLLASSDQPEAADFLRKATQLKPTAHPEEGLERAWLSLGHVLEKDKPQEAVVAFEKAAQLQPKDPEPLLSAGAIYEREHNLPKAEQNFAEASKLDPKSSDAVAALVNVYTKQKKLPEAEAA
ncbi:MAG: tetratricopeptide repeat protein, partial [Acidobacteria bacterium]|nr:tetratricopeptide repeat protein [Acidobacteriota bacterium]